MKLTGCRSLHLGPETRVWYRAIEARYWPTALHTLHTKEVPTRFNPNTVQLGAGVQ
jgi:hypothetical protein